MNSNNLVFAKSLFQKFLLVFNIIAFSMIGVNALPTDSIGTAKINGKLHIKYLVSPGETIYGISTRNKISVSDLMEINPELESGLKVGQVINIPYVIGITREESPVASFNTKETAPVAKPSVSNTPDDKKTIHKVQAGETLYSLARKYNVSVNDLMKWNNIELKVGQEVVVSPNNSITATSSPANTSLSAPSKGGTVVAVKPVEKANLAPKPAETTEVVINRYEIDSSRQQILIIPFDPYLYFSDADDEIAATSKIPRTKIRQLFRRRMNSLLDHPAYENIHLLGGKAQDSLSDLNKIYTSVTYNYQDILLSPHHIEKEDLQVKTKNSTGQNARKWLSKQKDKIIPEESSSKAITAKDNGKYFGVMVKNPALFKYFNEKYDVDYYVFVNQFEVKTNYEHCLDRAALNYERTFTTHYSIFDSEGKQISGNRFNTHYNSNSNNIEKILVDNVQKIADRILGDLPIPKK